MSDEVQALEVFNPEPLVQRADVSNTVGALLSFVGVPEPVVDIAKRWTDKLAKTNRAKVDELLNQLQVELESEDSRKQAVEKFLQAIRKEIFDALAAGQLEIESAVFDLEYRAAIRHIEIKDRLADYGNVMTDIRGMVASIANERPYLKTFPHFEGPAGGSLKKFPYFSGRSTEMNQLIELMGIEENCTIISGLVGVGKSAMIRQFAALLAEEGRDEETLLDGVFWIRADNLTADVERIARQLEYEGNGNPGAYVEQVLKNRRCLLIIDGLSSEHLSANHSADEAYLPIPGGLTHTFITSNEGTIYRKIEASSNRLQLGMWDEKTSTEYLKKISERCRDELDQDLNELAKFVGGLPLAIQLIGVLMEMYTDLSASELKNNLELEGVDTLDRIDEAVEGEFNEGMKAAFMAVWGTLSDEEKRVLTALSVCAEETNEEVLMSVLCPKEKGKKQSKMRKTQIEGGDLRRYAAGKTRAKRSSVKSRGFDESDRLNKILTKLEGLSLVSRDGNVPPRLVTHKAVRICTLAVSAKENAKQRRQLVAAHEGHVREHINKHAKKSDINGFLKGLEECLRFVKFLLLESYFHTVKIRGSMMTSVPDLHSGLKMAVPTSSLTVGMMGVDTPDFELPSALDIVARLKTLGILVPDSVPPKSDHLGNPLSSPNTATSKKDMFCKDDLITAEECPEISDERRLAMADEHLKAICVILERAGRYGTVLEIADYFLPYIPNDTLEIADEYVDGDEFFIPRSAMTWLRFEWLGRKADALAALGRYQEAEQNYMDAFGPIQDLPTELANRHHMIAQLRRLQGSHETSLSLAEQAIKIEERADRKKPSYSVLVEAYNRKAVSLYFLGRLDEALEAIDKALEISRAHPRDIDDDDLSRVYQTMGLIQDKARDYDGAVKTYDSCLGLQIKSLGKEHPLVATTHLGIGLCHFRQGDYVKALKSLDTSRQMYETLFGITGLEVEDMTDMVVGGDFRDMHKAHYYCAVIHFERGDLRTALKLFKKAYHIMLHAPDVTDDTCEVINRMTDIHIQLGEFDEAFSLCKMVLELVIESDLNLSTSDTTQTIDELRLRNPNAEVAIINMAEVMRRTEKTDDPNAIVERLREVFFGLKNSDPFEVYLGPEGGVSLELGTPLATEIPNDPFSDLEAVVKKLNGARDPRVIIERLSQLFPDFKVNIPTEISPPQMPDTGMASELSRQNFSIAQILRKFFPDLNLSYFLRLSEQQRGAGHFDLALHLAQHVLQTYERMEIENHPTRAKAHQSLGHAYLAQGNQAEALFHLQQALRIMQKILGDCPAVEALKAQITSIKSEGGEE